MGVAQNGLALHAGSNSFDSAELSISSLENKVPQKQKQLPILSETKHEQPFTESTREDWARHMAFYLAPFASNDEWARNCNELFRRIELFNGRRLVALAHGPGLHHPDPIVTMFERRGCDVLLIPHDPRLRDMTGFPALIRAHYNLAKNAVLWFGHGKGVSGTCGQPQRQWWRNTMFEWTLGRYERCMELLLNKACVGTHRIGPEPLLQQMSGKGPIPAKFLQGGVFHDYTNAYRWHFAGTFFWVRCAALYSRNWDRFGKSGWYAEAYLGDQIPYEETACVAWDAWHPPDTDGFGDHIVDDPGYAAILAEWSSLSKAVA
jgi:hypothetical protein